MTALPPRSAFPADFVFGTSTSAYQIEGHAAGGAGPTHWDTFAATPGNVKGAENGDVACDHLHRYEEDLDLVRDAGLDAYRFSTSWARILPEGRVSGGVNEAGLDFYDRLVDACLARGIQPWACLYHWELPAALADLGGWRNADIPHWFAEFAEVVMRRIGDRLHAAATFNEPWCIAWLSHFLGRHAPGLRDVRAATRAMHHVLVAHGRGTQAMRAVGTRNCGVVMNFEYAAPATDAPEDVEAARTYEAIYDRWFIDAIFSCEYPAAVLAHLEPHMPRGWQDDFDVIAQPMDWLGVNYYTRKLISHDASIPWPHAREGAGDLPKTLMGWEIYPEGLEHFLREAHRVAGDIPIFVTENGMASPDVVENGAVHDPGRIDYLAQHFEAARRAIAAGVPLKGFLVWSLLDNYEWERGYEQRFGLVHVDFDTLERTPKASWYALREALT